MVRGGGPGDPVNLDSVPYTTLSNAYVPLMIARSTGN